MSPAKKGRVGIVGCGGIGNSVHLPSLASRKAVQLAAAQEYDIPAVHTVGFGHFLEDRM